LSLAIAFAGTLAFVKRAAAYPKPSPYPITWELKFKHSTPKRITVDGKAYWYMTFTVTNKTDEEQLFLPQFDFFSREGKNYPSDKGVPTNVFNQIKKVERNGDLQPLVEIAGALKVGEDQTKEGVAIWPEPSPRMETFHIFVTGLSGEAVITEHGEEKKIKDWTKISDAERKKQNVMRKTLDLTFQVNGDGSHPDEQPAHFVKEEWVMR
jgi:hypothetical protein